MNTDSDEIRYNRTFYKNDVLDVAPKLLGSRLKRKINSTVYTYLITEIEIYRGEEDEACHARKGKTKRTEVMYQNGGLLYIYLIYGMHWMLNIVTGKKEQPQAILIRGLDKVNGPGRVTRELKIDGGFNRIDLHDSELIWIEKYTKTNKDYITTPRIGIDYAGDYYRNIPWRYVLKQ